MTVTNIDGTEKEEISNVFINNVNNKIAHTNNELNQVNDIFNKIASNLLSETTTLNANIQGENNLIDHQIEENESRINRSSIVKWEYQKPLVEDLKYQNNILFIIFYVLVLILGAAMYFFSSANIAVQIVVFHVLLIWPFLIYYLELFFYIIFKYLYSYTYGIPYEKVYMSDS